MLDIQGLFLSILSRHVEHNKWPFLIQKVLVDLSISLRQIKHLKIGAMMTNNNLIKQPLNVWLN
mgnify:CR=1 FL=1